MIKVVGIGANVHDTLIVLPEYPAEDTKLRAKSKLSVGGGPCATGLVACAKLGQSCAFLGNVSDDESGKFLIADFKKYGVETKYMTAKENCDSFVSYVMLSEKTASRTIVFDKGNVPPLVLSDEQKQAICGADILMVDGNDLAAAIEGARIAREHGTKVLYDAGGLYDGVLDLLPLCDIIIPSEEYALAVTGADDASDAAGMLFEKYRPDVVVVTCGKSGGVIHYAIMVISGHVPKRSGTMAKFSVKKPLTVFVVVLAVVVLGVVAYLKMTPDLLPNMDFPYVVIVTTDPGASPESVEEEITRPMEQSMATLDQIKTVTSTSQNSVSMVMLEFEDGVNMDTISVDIQQKISVLQGQWDDMVGAPYVLKINPSMIPVMVAAVSQEGKDVYALSDLVTDELTGKLEGVTGVASVAVSGALTREAHVILDQEKMDALSATLADAVKEQLKKAEGQLYDAQKQVSDGEKALSEAKPTAWPALSGTPWMRCMTA